MYCCYKNDENRQQEVDLIISKIFDNVRTIDDWNVISIYFRTLCEISPKVVLHRLNNEFKNNTGLLDIFEKQNSDFLFGRNAYIDILFGIEDLIVQKMYARAAVQILIKINGKGYRYVSNKPDDLIKKCICTWCNTTAIEEVEEKIEIAQFALRHDVNAWNYIKEEISSLGGRSIVTTSSGPQYREKVENKDVTLGEYYNLKDAYTNLLLDNMDFRFDRWNLLLKVASNQSEEGLKRIFTRLREEVMQMGDDEIIKIKNCIRGIIYRHRYFKSSEWSMSEEAILEFEHLLGELCVSEEELEYEYLFNADMEFPLLHPVSYEKDEFMSGRDANKQASNKLVQNKLLEFKEKKLDLSKLVCICARERNTLGEMLAKYWNDGYFNIEIFSGLLKWDKSGAMALDYCKNIKDYDEVFETILDVTKKIKNSKSIIVNLYKIQAEVGLVKPKIFKATKIIKEAYWKEEWIPIKDKYIRNSIIECKRYGTQKTFLKTLYIGYEYFRDNRINAVDIYDYMLGFEEMEQEPVDSFILKDILEILQNEFIGDDDRCQQIATWELYHFYQLDWDEMRCLKRELSLSPLLYADIINYIFKHDNDKEKINLTEQEKNRNSNLYNLYHKAAFCPGEINGVVDDKILNVWLKEFDELLEKNNQKSLKAFLLGRLFAFSPLGLDGHYPAEPIRDVIELLNNSCDIQELQREYVVTVKNQRGVYSPSGGEAERRLADDYKREADYHRSKYPCVAEIYDVIHDQYNAQADYEREAEENGWG
jgi:hypothetical protein